MRHATSASIRSITPLRKIFLPGDREPMAMLPWPLRDALGQDLRSDGGLRTFAARSARIAVGGPSSMPCRAGFSLTVWSNSVIEYTWIYCSDLFVTFCDPSLLSRTRNCYTMLGEVYDHDCLTAQMNCYTWRIRCFRHWCLPLSNCQMKSPGLPWRESQMQKC